MKTIEYRGKLDKSQWERGPWDKEPDKLQWVDEVTGLPCLIVRHPRSGHLCGYVGVSKGHPAFEVDYNSVPADVHGGLTFSEHCQQELEECKSVCHKVEDGEDDNVWWLGFDCAHSGDYSGFAYHRTQFQDDEVYRTFEYVKSECESLAQQLYTQG
jgi:hypothetical protein